MATPYATFDDGDQGSTTHRQGMQMPQTLAAKEKGLHCCKP
ncbi:MULTISPECIES: hypothetical protein [Xanthomonas]|nr:MULTISPECIES: hypothetical protein [Xanthomonas]MCW0449598.1 hypothetical protein [Xanthomonas sacchari]MDY4285550.1 hypothetical protein [Xanthomonas sp. LF06-19]